MGYSSITTERQQDFVGSSLGENVISAVDLVQVHPQVGRLAPWDVDILMLQTLHGTMHLDVPVYGMNRGTVGFLLNAFGLDDLDVTTGEDGAAGLRVGKYINDNVYTDVTVDSTGKSEINLNLTLTPSLTARGTLSSSGDTGLGLHFERDY